MTDLVLEIFRVNGLLLAAGDRLTRGLGLTSARWQGLGALEEGPLTAAQIARNMGLKRQSVQRLVDLLSEQGILAFEQNPHHRRAKLVRLTEAGRGKYAKMSRIQTRWANHVSQGFDAEELRLATNLLRAIEARLKESADLLIQPPGK